MENIQKPEKNTLFITAYCFNILLDFVISQLFFNNDDFFRFLDRLHKADVYVPVSAGIMPVIKAASIRKIVELSGALIPGKLEKIINKYSDSDDDMKKAGLEYASDQIRNLIEQNIDGIHLYTMNSAQVAKIISSDTGLR